MQRTEHTIRDGDNVLSVVWTDDSDGVTLEFIGYDESGVHVFSMTKSVEFLDRLAFGLHMHAMFNPVAKAKRLLGR